VIGVSASWVGDGVAWVTDIRQAWAGPHTMPLAPNGPLVTVRSILTCPLASAVTVCMPFRAQSPGPVAAPLAAHWVTTRDSPGEKPDACTRASWPDLSPVAGVTVTFWCPVAAGAEEVAVAEAVAGAVVVAGGGVVVGLRVTGAGLLPHPAASTASTAAAAQRRENFTMLTCRPRIWALLVVRPLRARDRRRRGS
jgi:hypothetical protein